MDETQAAPAPVVNDNPAPVDAPPADAGTTPEPSIPDAPADGTQVPADSPPATTDPDLPDHGVDPDKGIDPDKGDDAPADKSDSELKGLSRAERKEYFESIERQTRKNVEQAIDAVYQPQAVEEVKAKYLKEGYSEFESTLMARDEVREQEKQISEARGEVAELNMTMATEAIEVVTSIPWLNSENGPQVDADGKPVPGTNRGYDQASTEAASQLYEQLAVVKDQRTGQIIEALMSPKQFYTLIDQIRSSGMQEAELKARKAAEKELSSVAPPSSTTNKRDTAFESLSPAEQRAQLQAKGYAVT